MKAEIKFDSVDYDITVYDDLHLTFYDADTNSKVEVTLPEHVAKNFKEDIITRF